MRNKKRLLSIIFSFILVFCIATSFVGCSNMKTSTDGIFNYCYTDNRHAPVEGRGDGYAIIGASKELPETLYVPAYYKGKEVHAIYYVETGLVGSVAQHGLDMKGVRIAYLPYACSLNGMSNLGENFERAETTFITYSESDLASTHITSEYSNITNDYLRRLSQGSVVYFSSEMYCRFVLWLKGGALLPLPDRYVYRGVTIKAANTAYMFNYEGCPNNGYFFINDFEYGKTMENTPYEPLRAGYTFGGWYKEPKCINVWDFETDTLPSAQYNEDGQELYQETKLYAKWIKK